MPSPSNKKLMMLYILKIMQEYSDAEHPLKQQEIADKVLLTYGMECERKAIANNLKSLEDFGYDIVQVPNKGWLLGERNLEPSEISFLVDAVFSSKVIDSRQSQRLAAKLFNDLSIHQRRQYNYIYKADELTRSENKQVFYTIDTLNIAISQRRKVSFDYIGYSVAEGKTLKRAVVDPYYMINNNGKYYLVCCRCREWGLSNYRIDRMENITATEEERTPIEEVKGCEAGFDIATYANENIYMFGGGAVNAKILVTNNAAIGYIYDWFGKNVSLRKEGEKMYACVKANEEALVYWALQYGEIVEVLEPKSTRTKIQKLANGIVEKYKL